MIAPSTLLAYTLFALTVVLLPGPDMLYTLSQSVRGRVRGIVAACSIATGLSVHFTLAGLGLSALLAANHVLFLLLRMAGAAYLLYLAWKLVSARPGSRPAAAPERRGEGMLGVYLRGVLTNLLNPKALLFVMALLPQFVHPSDGNPALQIAVFGGIFVGLTLIVFNALALFGFSLGQRLRPSPRIAALQRWLAGGFFAGSALYLVKEAA